MLLSRSDKRWGIYCPLRESIGSLFVWGKGCDLMARPKKEIDQSIFENLCSIQCTLAEIAGVFNCSEDTIERWCKRTYNESFAESFKKYSAEGKTSLRRAQFKLAEKNAAMAIFLGKQYLGQRDQIEVENDNDQVRAFIMAMREQKND
jgi:AraC-like DNA-binding protein